MRLMARPLTTGNGRHREQRPLRLPLVRTWLANPTPSTASPPPTHGLSFEMRPPADSPNSYISRNSPVHTSPDPGLHPNLALQALWLI